MRTNKHRAVFDYLMGYAPLKELFFNFSQAQDNYVALIPIDSDSVIKTYNDGSRERVYIFAVVWYKDFSVAKADSDKDFNLSAIFDVERFMDWIDEQEQNGYYPDFGESCSVWSIENLQDTPHTEDENADKNLARYIFSCKIKYLEECNNA